MTIDRKQQLEQKNLKLSFVVPVHNEEAGVVRFVRALVESAETITHHHEIILINDGSEDCTLEIIEKELLEKGRVKLLSFSRNFGKENAITAGLHHCRGDVAIIIDADFQHPLSSIPDLVNQWTEGFDMVYGLRRERDSESFLKRLFSRVFYRLISAMSDTKIPPHAGDFRLLDRKVVDAINTCGEYNRFMKGLYAWVGFKTASVIYDVQERQSGVSSFSFSKLFDLAMTGLISFSDLPLRVWSLMGIAISGVALVYALIIILTTNGTDPRGFPTLMVCILFLGGIQLISIGVLGEYIARIFREIKRRPQYVLEKKLGFDEDPR